MFKRARHQFGWLERKKRKRGPEIWVWRYHESAPGRQGSKRAVFVGDVKQYPTKADAWKAAEGIRLAVANPPNADVVTFGALINRFLREALPERKGTADRYQSWIVNHINPHWEQVPLSKVKPLAVEIWLKGLNLAPKSKGHIRSVMHILFEWAMRWELIEYNRNPMSLLKLKGLTKRVKQPRALTVEELHSLWSHLDRDTKTMSMVAVSLGLRASELFGLRWEDFDWKGLRVKIQRSWVYGRVESTKTEGSEKWLPLDQNLADILCRHRDDTPDELLQTGWVFVSPFTGKPWWAHKIVRYHLRPAAEKAGIGRIGWHTFRHTYSTLLHAYGTDMKVQQELLRHSDIRTTMNIYTHTVSPALREANSKVVRMILPERKTA
ncbi:MAG TPA: site-specific integrase [Terriglobales bacterium]|nr:site-specific integrase [Terriglobales bacterium]